MALDELISNRRRVPFLMYVEGNSGVLHLFCDGIIPQSVSVYLVQRQSHIWELPILCYHKIMVIYPYPFFVVITQFFPA